jgi:hypothetical protein
VRHYVRLRPSEKLTFGLGLACATHDGDMARALQSVASGLEFSRARAAEVLGVRPDEDIPFDGPTGPGWYGYALRSEGYTIPTEDFPERAECRMVHAVTRDGLSWWITRLRRHPPVRAVLMLPEADYSC